MAEIRNPNFSTEQLDSCLSSFDPGVGASVVAAVASKLSLSEPAACRALAERFALPFVDQIDQDSVRRLISELSTEVFKTSSAIPLEINNATLTVAVSDPFDFKTVMEIEYATGLRVEPSLAAPTMLQEIRDGLFKGESALKQSAGKLATEFEKHLHRDETAMTLDEIKKRTESEPVVKMVNLVFSEAINQRASDVHIEPSENDASIRFRIDGMLRHHMELSKWMFPAVTSRIKILADLDIAEKRIPQDGRVRFDFEGREYDFRVSTLPTHHGEKTVVRILKHDQTLLDLTNLGLAQSDRKQLAELIEKPQGMIFVTGPTGSGKSSTLFACLNCIRNKEINITTIENPIEYKLDGVNQVQINEKAGVTFAAVLRSILRQDPDVILVGEIRDPETAEIALQASQTGHLVLSTLHTNDAVSAITRLRDLGVPSFMISSSLLAIVGQRLVRMLCPQCREEVSMDDNLRKRWDNLIGTPAPEHVFSAKGCKSCGKTGYQGRIGIFEVITVGDTIRTLVGEDLAESALRKRIREQGVKSMIANGVEKVVSGTTTPEELLRVVMVEDSNR